MNWVLDIIVLGGTILLMVTLGMELDARDFREVARRKGVLLGTLLLPTMLLPVRVFALARALAQPQGVAMAYRRWRSPVPRLA